MQLINMQSTKHIWVKDTTILQDLPNEDGNWP